MISKRLKVVSDFINPGDTIIDIGCDHGLLDIYLVNNNIVDKCYVSDINSHALENAVINIKKANLEGFIIPVLANGLEAITNDEIDTIVISGLGAYNIIDILKNKKKLKNISKIIIQANNNHYELRKYLEKINFYIRDETLVYDNNKYYVTMLLRVGYKKYSYQDLLYGPILKTKKSNLKYFEYLRNSYQKVLVLLPKSKLITLLKLKYKIYLLDNILKSLR